MSRVVGARRVSGILIVAGVALVAWLFLEPGIVGMPNTQPRTEPVRRQDGPTAPDAAFESVPHPVRSAHARASVQVLSRDGEPLHGATVHHDGAQYIADEVGRVSFVSREGVQACRVTCEGHLAEEGVPLTGELTTVRLRPAITIEIQAVRDEAVPVVGAQFWARPHRLSQDEVTSADGSPSAVTNESGQARIGPFEFPVSGMLFLQCCHEEFAYCYHAQEGGRSMVFRESGRHTLTVRFVTPRIIAIEPPETGVVTWKTQLRGNATLFPENPEASWTCKRVATRIQERFPKAIVTMVLPAYPPGTSQSWDPLVTMWLVGRQPVTVPCAAIPADEFVAPQKLEPPEGLLHDGFGSLRAVLTDVAGDPLPASAYRWIGDLTEDWQGDRNLLVMPKGMDMDGWMVLPTGTWRVDFYDAVLNAMAKRQSSSTVTLTKGGMAEARVALERKVVRCRYEASFEGDGPRPTAGVVRLQNSELGLDIPFLRNSTLQAFEFLLPEGENTVVVEARTSQDGPLLVGRTVISIRASDPVQQPVIRVQLVPKR